MNIIIDFDNSYTRKQTDAHVSGYWEPENKALLEQTDIRTAKDPNREEKNLTAQDREMSHAIQVSPKMICSSAYVHQSK